MLTYKTLIHKTYEEYIAKAPVEHDLKIALRTHERLPKFLENLDKQFIDAQNLKLKKDKRIYPDHYIVEIVESMTEMFLRTIIHEAEAKKKNGT